ncbi:cyclin-dependent kinase 11B isoform X2 [Copidosoma floridanum]|uniref:cyclin-dependent kinase 11B isoform X2 n=1 Tax=Copidosoma floridanum TaxID=29053 RepID=UPI0006C9501C|nr:cyclin-dependent kinase 11B isoform X2 [Copidosoma floridanum]
MPAVRKSISSYSEGEGVDTTDSLEIKPPQAVVRHRKATSSHRRNKHSDRSREDKERSVKLSSSSSSTSRHHGERDDTSRYVRDSGGTKHSKHRRHGEIEEKTRRSDPSKREREPTRHERKERSTGDRVLEDLRERLLDKRRERREDMQDYKMESSSSSSRRGDSSRDSRGGERREVRVEDLRERREIRMAAEESMNRESQRDRREIRMEDQRSNRHMRMEQDSYPDVEIVESNQRISSGREKRHKRSHKHERTRDREREKMEKEIVHREKHARDYQMREHQSREHHSREHQQVIEDFEELERMEAMSVSEHQHQQLLSITKDPKEMTEQELRRQRLIEANREMSRIKENSRLELENRRKMRGEKRQHSPELMQLPHDPSVVELSDESIHIGNQSDRSSPKSIRSRASEEDNQRDRSSDDSSSSSSTSTDDDDDSTDSKNSEDSEYNNPSPLSVDQLAKSDRSGADSPGHIDSNGTDKISNNNETIDVPDKEVELPPYIPAVQGCRSVEEYKCLNRIAEGTYGVVYRAEDRRTKEIVALKRLKMEKEKDGFPITSLREINTLLKAQHPNIVTVREIVVGSNMDKIFIVMDYVEHDLKSLMETMKMKNRVFIPGEIKCLMKQLLAAVAHLHDNWILHRDLKTSNLLLSHRGILKVGDFGLAREYGSPLKQYTSIVVTLWYRAPELLLGAKEYSTPIDMWSVGCIFAELLRMEALFPGKSEIELLNRIFKELGTPSDRVWPGYSKLPMVKKIPFAQYPVNSIRQRFGLSLSDLGIELLVKFLTYDPAQRITAEKALEHSYFSESPLPIDPAMFPTWPAKSEFGVRTVNASPKPPSGGKEFKALSEDEDNSSGFHMGSREAGRPAGVGFQLRF